MAIGLSDIQKRKQGFKQSFSAPENDKLLRPWQSYDNLGTQTRTYVAQEAVRKAKDIVKKNNRMVEDFIKNMEAEFKKTEEIEKKSPTEIQEPMTLNDNSLREQEESMTLNDNRPTNEEDVENSCKINQLKLKIKPSIYRIFHNILGY